MTLRAQGRFYYFFSLCPTTSICQILALQRLVLKAIPYRFLFFFFLCVSVLKIGFFTFSLFPVPLCLCVEKC